MQYLKTTLLVLLLFIAKSGTCQYQSIFGDTSTQWNVLTAFCDAWCYHTLYTDGDTVINGNAYKKISGIGLPFLLREDTTQGKVWRHSYSDTTEYLLMDLSLAVGDTFSIYDGWPAATNYYAVDSVYYFDNKKHIRLMRYTNEGCFIIGIPLTFIEGVGTNLGLSYEESDIDHSAMLCYTKNTTTNKLFANGYYNSFFPANSCEYCMSSTKQLLESQFTIFPNPFTSEITLSAAENQLQYAVYDVVGSLVKMGKTYEKNSTIQLENLQTGIYILVLKNEKGVIVGSKKIVKSH